MRIRNNSNADNELNDCEKYLKDKESLDKIILKNSSKRINLEIGMGKGEFILNLAIQKKDEIFIGVELCKSVLALAIKKIKRYEVENNVSINNLYLMSFDASNILEYIDKDSIDNMYLNFSDPWPKKRHEKRRLTYKSFLELYKAILKYGCRINFKTDNRAFFEYSVKSMNNFGMKFEEVYLDLHKTDVENVLTEYEKKFCVYGPIYKVVCKF